MIAIALAFALASQQSASFNARYMGDLTCASWSVGGAYTNPPKASALNWVLGFIYASGVDRDLDLLARTNHQAVAEWLDGYCRVNPSSSVTTGAYRLRDALISEARPD